MLNKAGGRTRSLRLPLGAALLFALLTMACCTGARAEILINEVMASNGYFEDGHAWDWVEIYNNGTDTVDLSGWYFSDSAKKEADRWRKGNE